MARIARGTRVTRITRIARVARVARGIMLSYLIHPSYLSFFNKNFVFEVFIFIFGLTNDKYHVG